MKVHVTPPSTVFRTPVAPCALITIFPCTDANPVMPPVSKVISLTYPPLRSVGYKLPPATIQVTPPSLVLHIVSVTQTKPTLGAPTLSRNLTQCISEPKPNGLD